MKDSDIISFVRPYTSVSTERIMQLLNAVQYIVENNIPGDFAEIGVWKGGLIMAMALKLQQLGVVRTIHAYDTFEGMTEPSQHDVDCSGYKASDILGSIMCRSGYDETVGNIKLTGYKDIIYHVGDIRKTDVEKIPEFALLRLDTDWYELTKFELEYFEPKVRELGVIIVDDYGHWGGCKKAVDEFLVLSPQTLIKADYTGVHWIKSTKK